MIGLSINVSNVSNVKLSMASRPGQKSAVKLCAYALQKYALMRYKNMRLCAIKTCAYAHVFTAGT